MAHWLCHLLKALYKSNVSFHSPPCKGLNRVATWCSQDGTIKYEIKLTGKLSTIPLSFEEETPEYGTLVMTLEAKPHITLIELLLKH